MKLPDSLLSGTRVKVKPFPVKQLVMLAKGLKTTNKDDVNNYIYAITTPYPQAQCTAYHEQNKNKSVKMAWIAHLNFWVDNSHFF